MTAASEPASFDPTGFGTVPGARTIRRWMRTARKRRAEKSFGQLFEDAYIVVFTVVMLGATGGNLLRELNGQAAICDSYFCWEALSQIPVVLVPLLVGMTIRALLSIGPVSASRATGFWLLATPLDRIGLLRPSYRLVMLGTIASGAVVSFAGWMMLGFSLAEVALATILTTVLLTCIACLTVWAQQVPRRVKTTLRLADLLLLLALLLAVKLAAGLRLGGTDETVRLYVTPLYAPYVEQPWYSMPELQYLLIGACGLIFASVLVLVTAQTLDKLTRASVIAGGDLLTGIAGAAVALDVSLLADVVSGRHWRSVARRTSRRGRGFGPAAVVQREFLRILRWPRRLVVCFALLVVPYTVAGAGFELVVPVTAAIAGFVAVRPLLDGMRSALRSPGLLRAFGMTPGAVRRTFAVVPGIVTVLWITLASPSLGDPVTAFAVAAGILAGAVRQASAPPPSYGGPLLASPMGAIPPGLFSQPLRGPDLLLLCLVPLLLGLSPLWTLLVPAAVLTALFLIEPKRA